MVKISFSTGATSADRPQRARPPLLRPAGAAKGRARQILWDLGDRWAIYDQLVRKREGRVGRGGPEKGDKREGTAAKS